MKKYVFIGAYDKTDMLLYIAKILTIIGKKVLLVDTTILKKSRYIVPTMVNEKRYITNYDGVDVAIGFDCIESIAEYQIELFGDKTDYDIVLLDVDRAIAYQRFQVKKEDKHYFVTSFDVFNLKRGIEVLAHISSGAKVTKIYYTKSMLMEEDQYFSYLAKDYKIHWNKDIVFFPFETSDQNTIYVNQRLGEIHMRGLSSAYIDSILFLCEDISGENAGKIRKAYKILDG